MVKHTLHSSPLRSLLALPLALSAFMVAHICSTERAAARAPDIKLPKPRQEQRALDLKGKMGIGWARAPLDVSGLSLNIGAGSNLFLEAIIGGNMRTPTGESPEAKLATALGVHLQLFQTQTQAALTIGARFHLRLNEDCVANDQLCASRQLTTALNAHYLVDVPIRIYWFPVPHISLHTELGVSVRWGTGGASSRGYLIDGYSVHAFDDLERVGSLGFTFWFPPADQRESASKDAKRSKR